MNARIVLSAVIVMSLLHGCGEPTPEKPAPPPTQKQADEIVQACWDGDLAKVSAMLEAQPGLLAMPDNAGYTPLLAAAEAWEFDIVKLLVEKGAPVNVTYRDTRVWPMDVDVDPDNKVAVAQVKLVPHGDPTRTPLHYVAAGGRADVVRLMLAAGADPHARNRDSDTPVTWAAGMASEHALETVRLLFERGARPGCVDDAILQAALGNNMEVVAFLRSKREKPETPYAFWRAAAGAGPDRMRYRKRAEATTLIYRTLWQRPEGECLICMHDTGGGIFGTTFEVLVFDRKMNVLKQGAVMMDSECFPYALVEIKADGEVLPEKARGKWLLATAHLSWPEEGGGCERALDMTRPRVLVPWYHTPDDKANYISVALVAWRDDGFEYKYGTGNTSALKEYRFRWAETGPNVFDRMLENYHR